MGIGVVLQILWGLLFLWIVYATLSKSSHTPAMRTVAVLVLGDIGRSPRMMYHAESFAKSGFVTVLVGYKGADPISSLLTEPLVRLRYIPQLSSVFSALPFMLLAPLKIGFQISALFFTFFVRMPEPPEFIIVQNPPSIPTLAFVWFVGKCLGSKVIIDWHNLGYTILALKLGESHQFVRLAKKFEATFGQSAYAHLFVTKAMKDYLVKEWKLQGHTIVLHDRPPAHFHRTSASEAHQLFISLERVFKEQTSLRGYLPPSSTPFSTPFTHIPSTDGSPLPSTPSANSPIGSTSINPLSTHSLASPEFRSDRPALVVSSTSWTPDEDFGLLLRALSEYENAARERDRMVLEGIGAKALPKLLVVVTGRGPQQQEYMERISRLHNGIMDDGSADKAKAWKWVRCISVWLSTEDYPRLLGAADLGVSLHSSSSALDLPMKIVDMFGCGLPVCALNFACLDELVQDGENGLVFNHAEQLTQQLQTLFDDFPKMKQLEHLRTSLVRSNDTPAGPHGHIANWSTWSENWDSVMKPLISVDIDRYAH